MASKRSARALLVDSVCGELFGARLAPLGFVSIGPRRWGRPRLSFCKDLFELQTLKGATVSPRWGFSFDFTPHVASGRVRWHRTLKSAVFDVVDDPVDTRCGSDLERLQLFTQDNEKVLRRCGTRSAKEAVPLAELFWAQLTSPSQLPMLFESLKSRETYRFAFHNYVQQPLACAFSLARLGSLPEAHQELEKAYDFRDADESLRSALKRALDAAARDGFP